MKRYYTGNINKVYVKNLIVNNGNISKINLGYKVLKEGALFYENMFGVIISADNDFPMFDLSEAEDIVTKDVKVRGKQAITSSCSYYDTDSFKPINLSKEERKQLVLKRKNKSRD